MKKRITKALSAAVITASVLLAAGCSAASADEDAVSFYPNEEITLGNYYLDGDTSNEYIKITEGFGFEYVGFDFYQMDHDLDDGYLEAVSGEEKQALLEEIENYDTYRLGQRYYQIQPIVGLMVLKNTPDYIEGLGGECIEIIDEKTLKFDDEHIYTLVEE